MARKKKLTEEQEAEYIKYPNACPYCGSENLEGGTFEQDDNYGWRDVTCKDCKKAWQDLFTLTGIMED